MSGLVNLKEDSLDNYILAVDSDGTSKNLVEFLEELGQLRDKLKLLQTRERYLSNKLKELDTEILNSLNSENYQANLIETVSWELNHQKLIERFGEDVIKELLQPNPKRTLWVNKKAQEVDNLPTKNS